jgi:hypothetical protein
MFLPVTEKVSCFNDDESPGVILTTKAIDSELKLMFFFSQSDYSDNEEEKLLKHDTLCFR